MLLSIIESRSVLYLDSCLKIGRTKYNTKVKAVNIYVDSSYLHTGERYNSVVGLSKKPRLHVRYSFIQEI